MQEIITLEEAKAYMNVFFEDDDKLIRLFIDTAKAYMFAKTSIKENELNEMQINAYKSCIYALVFDLYENRGATVGSNKSTVTQSTNKLIDELCVQITHFL